MPATVVGHCSILVLRNKWYKNRHFHLRSGLVAPPAQVHFYFPSLNVCFSQRSLTLIVLVQSKLHPFSFTIRQSDCFETMLEGKESHSYLNLNTHPPKLDRFTAAARIHLDGKNDPAYSVDNLEPFLFDVKLISARHLRLLILFRVICKLHNVTYKHRSKTHPSMLKKALLQLWFVAKRLIYLN